MKHLQLILITLAIFAMCFYVSTAVAIGDDAKQQIKAAMDKAGVKPDDVAQAVKNAGDKIKAVKGL